jgi:RimJ/RimL family protein N-acetyltransferase
MTHDAMTFDWQPVLKGQLLELRPLRPEDFRELYAVAADPLIWEQHPAKDRWREEVFRELFRQSLESGAAWRPWIARMAGPSAHPVSTATNRESRNEDQRNRNRLDLPRALPLGRCLQP